MFNKTDISIIIAGDFAQLPPVRAKPLYSDLGRNATYQDICGKALYYEFEDIVIFDQNKRQENSDHSFRKGFFFSFFSFILQQFHQFLFLFYCLIRIR